MRLTAVEECMMSSPSSSRFVAPTSSLDLGSLLQRLRRTFWISVGVAVALHVAVMSINPFETTQAKAPRPLSTKFVKREPRLTKPLELRKVPKPKRQMIRRQVRVVAARMDQVQATSALNTGTLLRGTGPSRMHVSGPASTNLPLGRGAAGLEPTLAAVDMATSRVADGRIDMALEMLDVNSMDTGRYQAMVVQDPNDRQALKGFVKFAHVIAASSIEVGSVGHGNLNLKTIDLLVDGLNDYTGIKAQFIGSITYDDERLMDMPVIIPQGTPNESEMEHLAKYVLAGGFIFGGVATEYLEKYGGLVNGEDFWTQQLADTHPLFSAFFDVRGGATVAPSTQSKNYRSGWRGLDVTGYFVLGRLAGIGGIPINSQTRTLQMDINVIVYALTQEGSMTQRLMQMVN
jgi:hypothetical protein